MSNIIHKNRFRVSITPKCNMQCIYCHNEGNNSSRADMSIPELDNILSLGLKLGINEIRLTGGEPLLHPDIKTICGIIKNKFRMTVSINTNLVRYHILNELLQNNLVDYVVVGVDYYKGKVSKNSPIGLSSKNILGNVLKIRESYGDIVSISAVYNKDYDNMRELASFCIDNLIRLKIIEQQSLNIDSNYVRGYMDMKNQFMNTFSLTWEIDEYSEMHGKLNENILLSFFQSFCRLKQCQLCKVNQLRITSDGYIKTCIFKGEDDFKYSDYDALSKLHNIYHI